MKVETLFNHFKNLTDKERFSDFGKYCKSQIRKDKRQIDKSINMDIPFLINLIKNYKDGTPEKEFIYWLGNIFIFLDDLAEERDFCQILNITNQIAILKYFLSRNFTFYFIVKDDREVRLTLFKNHNKTNHLIWLIDENEKEEFLLNQTPISGEAYWAIGGLFLSPATNDNIDALSNKKCVVVKYDKKLFRNQVSNSDFKFIHQIINPPLQKKKL